MISIIKTKWLAVILILIIMTSVGFLLFVWQPEMSQQQLYAYNNTHLDQRTGFIQDVHCPYGYNDTITPIGTVSELIDDSDVVGSRIYLNGIFYCPTHHIWFNVH